MNLKFLLGLFIVSLGIFIPGTGFSAEKEVRYYMTLGSYQPANGVGNPTQDGIYTHTYASFVKVEGNDQDAKILEEKTISWGPCVASAIKVLPRVYVVPGCNKDLETTLNKLEDLHSKVGLEAVVWGPVQILPGLYKAAKTQHANLRQLNDYKKNIFTSSQYDYAGVDWTERRRGIAKNCHHMVQDLITPYVNPKDRNYGLSAGFFITQWFKNNFIDYRTNQPWVWNLLVARELKGKSYPMIRFESIR